MAALTTLVTTAAEDIETHMASGGARNSALRQANKILENPHSITLGSAVNIGASVGLPYMSLVNKTLAITTGTPSTDGIVGNTLTNLNAAREGLVIAAKAGLPYAAEGAGVLGRLVSAEVTAPILVAQGTNLAVKWAKDHKPDTPEQVAAKGLSDSNGALDSAATLINGVRRGVEWTYEKIRVDPNSPASDASGTLDSARNLITDTKHFFGFDKTSPTATQAPAAVSIPANPVIAQNSPPQPPAPQTQPAALPGYTGSPRPARHTLKAQPPVLQKEKPAPHTSASESNAAPPTTERDGWVCTTNKDVLKIPEIPAHTSGQLGKIMEQNAAKNSVKIPARNSPGL